MKVILIAAVSADGKIAERRDQNSLDWTSKEDTRFFIEKTKECGVMVMGRTTFNTIGKPLKGRLIVILTHEESEVRKEEGLEYTNESLVDIVKRFEEEGREAIAIAGGASIYSQFLKAGLVTDLFLTVEPVLFGSGVPLAEGFDRINMKLVETRKLGEESVLLHYQI